MDRLDKLSAAVRRGRDATGPASEKGEALRAATYSLEAARAAHTGHMERLALLRERLEAAGGPV